MDKTDLVQTLLLSEKNHSLVKIKIFNSPQLLEGAVQKVLSHIIILKPAAARPVTLTFGDIEHVSTAAVQPLENRLSRFFKRLL